jgi:hypothetical protein
VDYRRCDLQSPGPASLLEGPWSAPLPLSLASTARRPRSHIARGLRIIRAAKAPSVRQDCRFRVRRERRIDFCAPDEVQRHVERLVVLGFRRNIGLRSARLVTLGLQMAAQRRFAPGLGHRRPRLDVLRHAELAQLRGRRGREAARLIPKLSPLWVLHSVLSSPISACRIAMRTSHSEQPAASSNSPPQANATRRG